MFTSTFIFCSLAAVFCGIMLQQTIETLINTSLTLLPFNIQTTS